MVVKSEKSYAHLAESYDQKRFHGANGKFNFESDRRIILEAVSIARPKKVIDVPVGTGRVLTYLFDHDINVIGVDLTSEMLDIARREACPERHTLQLGNAADLPFEDNQFDLLVSFRFFHLFEKGNRAQFTTEFARIVKPGGHVLVSFTNGWYAGGISWLRKKCGAKIVEFEHPGEIKQLFPGWRILQIWGNFLPKQWLLDGVPLLGSLLRYGVARWPLNRICWEKFYLLEKAKP